MLGDKGYLGAKIQKNLFEAANIMFEVTYRLNQKNRCSAIWSFLDQRHEYGSERGWEKWPFRPIGRESKIACFII